MELEYNEVKVILISLATLIEDAEIISKDQTIPFTPEARKMQAEILNTAKSAFEKLKSASGSNIEIDTSFKENIDPTPFLTKES